LKLDPVSMLYYVAPLGFVGIMAGFVSNFYSISKYFSALN
jgi:hypothetical protein